MRCYCCQVVLNDYESTRKSRTTGEYLDTCNKCFAMIEDDIDTIDRTDFSEGDITEDDFDDDFCVQYPDDDDQWQER